VDEFNEPERVNQLLSWTVRALPPTDVGEEVRMENGFQETDKLLAGVVVRDETNQMFQLQN
jgi:hypothetical protein